MSIPEEQALREQIFNEASLRGFKKGTSYSYFLYCRQMWNCVGKEPREINNEELHEYLVNYLKSEPAKGTIRVVKSALNFLYHIVLKDDREVLKELKGGKERRLPRYMSMHEVEILLLHVKKIHYQTMISLAFNCGMRVSEVAKLKVEHVDKFKMQIFVKSGKRSKDRYIPMPEKTYLMLRHYWAMRRPIRPYVFINPGTQDIYTYESIERAFRQARDAAKLNSEYTFHTLRHSYATSLIDAGIDIRMLQIYMGHKSLKTTMLYLHMTENLSHRSREIVNDLFGQFNSQGHA